MNDNEGSGHDYLVRMRARIELSHALSRLALVFVGVHAGEWYLAAFSHRAARRCLRAAARALNVAALVLLVTGCVRAGVTVKQGQPVRDQRSTVSYGTRPAWEPRGQRRLVQCGDCGQTRLNARGSTPNNSQMKTTFRKGSKR